MAPLEAFGAGALVLASVSSTCAVWCYRLRRTGGTGTFLCSRKEETDYVAMAIHEIRNLANAISMQTDILKKTLSNARDRDGKSVKDYIDEDTHMLLEDLYVASRTLHNFIFDLLEGGKSAHTKEVALSTVNITNAVSDILKILKGETHRKGLSVYIKGTPSPLLVTSDPTKLKQALLNILGNAVKYTNAGRIEIGYGLHKGILKVVVEDTGIGIPKTDLKKIASLYFRASNTGSAGGTGVGLYAVKHMLALLNGSIAIESVEGKGTRVTMSVPVDEILPP